jgi:hypothetical protein
MTTLEQLLILAIFALVVWAYHLNGEVAKLHRRIYRLESVARAEHPRCRDCGEEFDIASSFGAGELICEECADARMTVDDLDGVSPAVAEDDDDCPIIGGPLEATEQPMRVEPPEKA